MAHRIRTRSLEHLVVEEVTDNSVKYTNSTGHGLFEELEGKIQPGDEIDLETVNGSTISGIRKTGSGEWLIYKTDEDLDRERAEMLERIDRERAESLAKNRDDYIRRTTELPAWLRNRIDNFGKLGGSNFELNGWGYELAVCELAVIYAANGIDEDDEAVNEYAREHGTSGNQHGFAKALARAYLNDPTMDFSETVSALSPLTGQPFYEKKS